jgi:hypothetical protein
MAVMRIQAAHHCCGFRTPHDRSAPFPHGSEPDYDACEHKYKWSKPCKDAWKQDEQVFAGLFLIVAVVVFVLKVGSRKFSYVTPYVRHSII